MKLIRAVFSVTTLLILLAIGSAATLAIDYFQLGTIKLDLTYRVILGSTILACIAISVLFTWFGRETPANQKLTTMPDHYINAWITYWLWITSSILFFLWPESLPESWCWLFCALGITFISLYISMIHRIVQLGVEPKLSKSAVKASEPPKVSVIGPFISSHKIGHIRICIGFPNQEYDALTICINGREEKTTKKTENDPFRMFVFDIDNLIESQKYYYSFLESTGAEVDLQGGLSKNDCFFWGQTEFNKASSFILMSCHNPYETDDGSAQDGWERWPELLKLLDEDPSIKFMLLGGDQVYNDDVETEAFKYLDDTPRVERRFIRQYQIYWENDDYRKVMARIPTFAMWDDHDITDGWGGRPESYNLTGQGFKESWMRYFQCARNAFQRYQAIRNPPGFAIDENGIRPFSFHYDFGRYRIYALDLRSHKETRRKKLMSKVHLQALQESLQTVSPQTHDHVFFLTPVVAFRTNFMGDERLEGWSSALFKFTATVTKSKTRELVCDHLWKIFLGIAIILLACIRIDILCLPLFLVASFLTFICAVPRLLKSIPELPNLTDDLSDGLTSSSNMATFKVILDELFKIRIEKGVGVSILSGDIHLAGISEVIKKIGEKEHSIAQVVSSPISYKPMPKAAEGFTTTTSEMVIPSGEKEFIYGRNIFYLSKRNFARVFPGRFNGEFPAIYFYLEGHRTPLAMPAQYIPVTADIDSAKKS